MDSPERPAVSPAAPTPTGFYSQKLWGFIFPMLEPWTAWSVLGLGLRAPKEYLLIFIHDTWMWDHPFWQHRHRSLTTTASLLPHTTISPPQFPGSSPPAFLDEYALFKYLVARLPYSSILWQFWLFFVFRLVVILLMVVWRRKACLPMPSSWPEVCNEGILNLASVYFFFPCPLERKYQWGNIRIFLSYCNNSLIK